MEQWYWYFSYYSYGHLLFFTIWQQGLQNLHLLSCKLQYRSRSNTFWQQEHSQQVFLSDPSDRFQTRMSWKHALQSISFRLRLGQIWTMANVQSRVVHSIHSGACLLTVAKEQKRTPRSGLRYGPAHSLYWSEYRSNNAAYMLAHPFEGMQIAGWCLLNIFAQRSSEETLPGWFLQSANGMSLVLSEFRWHVPSLFCQSSLLTALHWQNLTNVCQYVYVWTSMEWCFFPLSNI